MYKLVVFCPLEQASALKEALFKVGAGKSEHYDRACYESLVDGQFRPLKGSNPTTGETGKEQKTQELRLEFICQEKLISSIITTLKDVHPYEVPAFEVTQLLEFS